MSRTKAAAGPIELTVDGLSVSVERKRIKNAYLRVLPPDGRVAVSAPARFGEKEIEALVRSRMAWITTHRAKFAGYRPRAYETGETLPYFGETLTLNVLLQKGRTKVERTGGQLTLTIRPDADAPARKRAVDAWYRKELTTAARLELPACEATVGRRAAELRVRDMKTRWGTCNPKTACVTVSLRLAERPRECLRYVLLHELCHLREAGHGKRFWLLMDKYCPDWKRIRNLLREPA